MNLKEKLNNYIQRLDTREYESHSLIEYNLGSRRSTWDLEYSNPEYDSIFETKFVDGSDEYFLLVGVRFD